MNHPVIARLVVHRHLAAGQLDRQAAQQAGIIDEEPLNYFALVSERNEELFEAVVAVVLHDVPQDGPAADFDHWFGPGIGLLRQPGAQSASQDDSFHDLTSNSDGPKTR